MLLVWYLLLLFMDMHMPCVYVGNISALLEADYVHPNANQPNSTETIAEVSSCYAAAPLLYVSLDHGEICFLNHVFCRHGRKP